MFWPILTVLEIRTQLFGGILLWFCIPIHAYMYVCIYISLYTRKLWYTFRLNPACYTIFLTRLSVRFQIDHGVCFRNSWHCDWRVLILWRCCLWSFKDCDAARRHACCLTAAASSHGPWHLCREQTKDAFFFFFFPTSFALSVCPHYYDPPPANEAPINDWIAF